MNYKFAQVVTPHATNPNVFDSLTVAGAGNLNVKTAAGDDVIIACAAGMTVPVAVTLVYAASTTATGITGYRAE